ISFLGGDDFDHDQKLGPHEPGNDTEHKNGPRGAEVTLTRELRFLPSNWAFARDVDYHVFLGREQQINRFPAAAGSSGSGSYFTAPDINPHSQVWQPPAPFEDSSCTSVRPTGTPPPPRTARSSRAVTSGRGRLPSSPRTRSRGYRPRTPPSGAASRSAGRLRASPRRPSRPTRPPAPAPPAGTS